VLLANIELLQLSSVQWYISPQNEANLPVNFTTFASTCTFSKLNVCFYFNLRNLMHQSVLCDENLN